MKTLIDRIRKKIIRKISEYRNWAFENWVIYNFLKNVYFILLFPLILLIGTVTAAVEWVYWLISLLIAVFFLLSFAFLLLDSKRVSVAQKKPADFIKVERMERFFWFLLFTLYPLWMILLVVFANGERIGITKEMIPPFQTFMLVLILAWTGLLMNAEFNILESSSLMKLIRKRLSLKDKWHLLEFYPSESIRASARFVVLSKFLSGNPDKRAIGRNFWLFYQGIEIYNDHLKDDFGFVLREPKRFYCQAKLAAYSKDNVDSIKNGLESLTALMKDENVEPFEIIKSLKEMLNEPATFNDVCAEIDADPERIKKWFSKHSEALIGIGGIILGVIAIIISITFH
jgi:hypothetical protein